MNLHAVLIDLGEASRCMRRGGAYVLELQVWAVSEENSGTFLGYRIP